MSKSLCKYRRAEILGQIKTIQGLVDQPRFLCKSCARVANNSSSLCKPVEFQTASQVGCKISNDEFCCPILVKKKEEVLNKRDKKLNKLIKKQKKLAKKYQKLLKKAQ